MFFEVYQSDYGRKVHLDVTYIWNWKLQTYPMFRAFTEEVKPWMLDAATTSMKAQFFDDVLAKAGQAGYRMEFRPTPEHEALRD